MRKKWVGAYLLLGCWLLGSTLLTMAYTSTLQAALVSPPLSRPLPSLPALLRSNIQIRAHDFGSVVEAEWAASSDPDIMYFSCIL